jgi:predicted HTH domain antitoxin
MKTMPYPVRIPKHLLELADLRAAEEQVDRSTALRQLLHVGAVTYVLDVLAKGRISLSKAAELLDATPLAIVEKAREHGVELGAHVDAYRAAEARERPAPHRAGKRRPRSTTRPGSP